MLVAVDLPACVQRQHLSGSWWAAQSPPARSRQAGPDQSRAAARVPERPAGARRGRGEQHEGEEQCEHPARRSSTWRRSARRRGRRKPPPRSGKGVVVHGPTLFLFGKETLRLRMLAARRTSPPPDAKGGLRERLGLTGTGSCSSARHTSVSCGVVCHGAARRRIGEVVHGARRPGGRARDHDDRGAGRERLAPSAPGELPHASRAPVRLLHERHGARGDEPARRESRARAKTRFATRSRATSAAARAIRTSSTRSRRWPDDRSGRSSRSAGRSARRSSAKRTRSFSRGQAQWVDNMRVPGMVYLGIVRSPYAHARITKVDVTPALAHADVVGAWSGEDIADEWQGSLPCAWLRPRTRTHRSTSRSQSTRRDMPATPLR